jgi:ATP-dependent exoDNAse (exonuclease V) beta subunit
MDQLGLRRLRRELRRLEFAAGGRRTSVPLLAEALDQPEDLATFPDRVRVPAERVARVLGAARAAAQAPGATAETVLWAAWSTSGLAGRWQAAAAVGGQRGAAADRDLDAVVALFDAAAKFTDRLPRAGPEIFLDDIARQQIPADTLAPHAPRGEVVRVLTAHAAKGLEWELVVVPGVQEGLWPDLRPRGSLLGSEQLVELVATGQPVPADQTGRMLDEERRLFYVACTRARRQLVVTAVDDSEAGESPSRFLDELPLTRDDAAVVTPSRLAELHDPVTLGRLRRRCTVAALVPTLRAVAADAGQPAATRVAAAALHADAEELNRSLDLSSLVAELRSVAADPEESAVSRRAAGARLAELAAAGVPGADPAEWYALLPLSDDRPLRGSDEKVRVSPSRVESFRTCQLRWLLESVGGTSGTSLRQSVGTLVHELAALTADPAFRSEQALLARLDERWAALDTGGGWFAHRQHEQARQMIRRFVGWLAERPDREVLGSEVEFSVDHGRAVLAGRVDRLERDEAGRGVVVDVKTGSSKPKPTELPEHPQLGAYQLAVALGAFADAYGVSEAGGASLLQVGKAATKQPEQRQPPLADANDPGWASQLVAEAAEGMAGSVFTARENHYCERCPVRTSCPLWDTGRQVVQP